MSYIAELVASRELLWMWTLRDFKVRYSQSMLGIAWAVVQPFSLMLIFSLIFSLFVRVPTNGVPYPVFVYVAILPWTFFSNSLTLAIPSLVSNIGLVTKIYFPREILPLSSILVGLVDFGIASLLFVLMMLFYRIPLGPAALVVPLALLIQIILTFGISLLASAINVFYRDVRFIIPLALQLWMYASPVIYPVDLVPENLRPFYFLNPMSVLIDAYRQALLYQRLPNLSNLGLAALVSCLFTVLAYRYFKQAEREFADRI